MLIPAILSADTVEGLVAEQGPEQPRIYQLLLLGGLVALASLPMLEVDVAVRSPGIIRAADERIELRSAVSGRLEQVLVRDNEQVKAGQPVVVLSSADVDERLMRNDVLQREHVARISDLQRVIVLAEEYEPGGLDSFVEWQTAAYAEEWNGYRAQLVSGRLAEARADNEQSRYAILAGKGIATQQELENARFETERLRAESRLLQAQTLARWQARLEDAVTALEGLASEEQRLTEERTHCVVRAPVDGVLVGFTGWSSGAFASAGQGLGSVSPDGGLLVEAQVSSRDAGLIRVGQPVRLQVDAYAYTWWGALEGEVTAIGGDSMVSGRGVLPGFKVLVRPSATTLTLPNGTRAELRKGLTVSARFLVARRSVLQLLYDEAGTWLNPQDRRPT
jgi:membrane fusion protein, peptide pheromone/bacteriocin exporter